MHIKRNSVMTTHETVLVAGSYTLNKDGTDTFQLSSADGVTSIDLDVNGTLILRGVLDTAILVTGDTLIAGDVNIEFDVDSVSSLNPDLLVDIKMLVTKITVNDTEGIPANQFKDFTALEHVIFSKMSGDIGTSAFAGCSKLASVSFPLMDGDIGTSAFAGCSKLASVSFPLMDGNIGNSAFNNCDNLASASFPKMTVSIGENAFDGCVKLASASFPKMTGDIGGNAFNGCSKLASVSFPEMAGSIGDNAFNGCEKLASASFPKMLVELIIAGIAIDLTKTALHYGGPKLTLPTPAPYYFKLVHAVNANGPDTDDIQVGSVYEFKNGSDPGHSAMKTDLEGKLDTLSRQISDSTSSLSKKIDDGTSSLTTLLNICIFFILILAAVIVYVAWRKHMK
jgi:hypothetical protein